MTGEPPASTLKPWESTPKSRIFRSESAGFSLVELLIVVTVIGIIASMAIPNLLRSKAAANEAVVIGYMRSWTAAQELYHMRHGVYADADNQLFDEGPIDGHAPVTCPHERVYLLS